ncbi:hypothetical protein [Cronobacter dublinensis]|uniref:hypothetical protein n=1 Tax=Cronobacter dublinensis TaxID=413497 RepID=UPI0024AF2901|nr:hypothetical protein [Cronobacter dublinensis]MDI7502033.1 hypothetical protein [Cronobacter dublinensis]
MPSASEKKEQQQRIQAALHEAALSLSKTPGVSADDISSRVQRLKETLEGVVYPDVTSEADSKETK